jgi:hypothetical protein
MDLELLSKPEQNLQSRLTATQALPFHSESEVKARALRPSGAVERRP